MTDAKSEPWSSTGTSRSRRWVICAFSLATLLNSTGAFAEGLSSGFRTRIVWKSTPPNNPLLQGNGKLTGKPEDDLRSLEADSRPSASRHLIQLSTQPALLENPSQRLALVRALSRHESRRARNDSVHAELLRTLIRLFAAEDEIGQLTADPEPENGALRHLARGTAAMALARSEHPLALKKLLATALSGDQTDPVGARLALTALRSLPQKALQRQELVRLFSATAIAELSDPGELTQPIVKEGLTPESLVLRAEAESVSRRNSLVGKELTPGSERTPAFERILVELLERQELPRSFSHVRAWEKAFASNPVWTLRTSALLGRDLAPAVTSWGERVALASLESSSELERSAAAFYLATVFPDSAALILERMTASSPGPSFARRLREKSRTSLLNSLRRTNCLPTSKSRGSE